MEKALKGKWSKEKAWEWYNSQPWIMGYGTYPSNCVNRIAMWQEYKHDEVLERLDYEFSVANENGFNAVRTFLQFDVWLYQHDSFMKNLEDYLTVASKYNQKVMIALGNDCTVAKSRWKAPVFGEQKIDWGYHSGIKGGQHAGDYREPGYQLIDEPELLEKYYDMIREIVGKYAKDERIQIWNVWNEIGNSNRNQMSVPYMIKAFEIARSCNPIQPLTADIWRTNDLLVDKISKEEEIAVELSDVITFHNYSSFETFALVVKKIKEKYGRPTMCTEWLNRLENNNVDNVLPLLYVENVGSYHWGLFQGFSQTFEPWGGYYIAQEKGSDKDLTLWQHDIFRFNGLAYIPKEIRTFKRFADAAKKDVENKQENK